MTGLQFLFKTLPWLGFFAAITISWIFYIKARNKERLALIEKGVPPEKIFAAPTRPQKFPWMKIGILITGICLGVLTCFGLFVLFPDSIVSDAIAFLMVIFGLLFGGISMLIASKINKGEAH